MGKNGDDEDDDGIFFAFFNGMKLRPADKIGFGKDTSKIHMIKFP